MQYASVMFVSKRGATWYRPCLRLDNAVVWAADVLCADLDQAMELARSVAP